MIIKRAPSVVWERNQADVAIRFIFSTRSTAHQVNILDAGRNNIVCVVAWTAVSIDNKIKTSDHRLLMV